MNPKQLEKDRDDPVFEWRLFKILHTIKTGSNLVAGGEHGSRDGRLACIDVVHQRGRADNATDKNN